MENSTPPAPPLARARSVTRSFIMIKKSMGPSTVPWGTPLFAEDQSEKTLSHFNPLSPSGQEVDYPIDNRWVYIQFAHLCD